MWNGSWSTTPVQCLRKFVLRSSSIAAKGQRRDEKLLPSPRGLPLLGTTLSLIAAGSATKLHEYIDARHRQLGPVFQENIGPLRAVFISDPEDIRRVFALEGKYPKNFKPEAWLLYNEMRERKRGLLFMKDEEWLKHRRIMNELLLRADRRAEFEAPADFVAISLANQWKTQSGPEVLNLEAQMYKWSFRVGMAVFMGVSAYARQEKEVQHYFNEVGSGLHRIMEKSVALSIIPPRLAAKLRLPAWTNFVDVMDTSLNQVSELVSRVLVDCKHSDGLLGQMFDAGMDPTVIQRIATDLIIAASDTSSYAMQWTLNALGRNPEVQEQLWKELRGLHTSHDIMQSTLLKNCVRETLRLYPVVPFLVRVLPEDSVIGGYTIPAGQVIVISFYTSGRDEKCFPEPASFCPGRWSRDSSRHYTGVGSPYATLPFAMGARSCIGRKIAEAELMLTTARLVKQFKMELIDTVPVEVVLRLVGVPSKPVRLWLTER